MVANQAIEEGGWVAFDAIFETVQLGNTAIESAPSHPLRLDHQIAATNGCVSTSRAIRYRSGPDRRCCAQRGWF